MRILFVAVLITGISGLVPVWGQSVEYGNNETSDYTSSQKSDNFTYLMWDRNDEGDGHFINSSSPKFFYWDNDVGKLHYLLDTGNMSQLDANFNSVGIGTTSPEKQLHISGHALISDERKLYFSRWGDPNDSGRIGYNNPYYQIGWDWPEKHERAMVFESYGILDSHGAGGGGYLFKTKNGSGTKLNALTIRRNGRVGIGTLKPTAKFTVNGKVKAKEVVVLEDVGADFVFEDNYPLKSLGKVEKYIQEHKHLPEIPSAKEMVENGVMVGDLQMKLLQKIEELTLYTITQQRILKELKENDKEQKIIIEQLQKEVKNLKSGKSQNE